MVEFEGIVDHIVYKNDENGYTVLKVKDHDDIISCVGYVPYIKEGQKVNIKGEWTVHPTFGQQIKIESCEEVIPSTEEGIEKYLSSGLIPGIGPSTAKSIVKMFGKDTMEIIEMNPEKLMNVEGIGKKKAEMICQTFKDQKGLRDVMVFLETYGITSAQGVKIYKKYGQEAVRVVKEDPYRLSDEIYGIGFRTADRIAVSIGIEPDSPLRVKAAIKYVLSKSAGNGHTYLPKDKLIETCMNFLEVGESKVNDAIMSLATSRQIVVDKINGDINIYNYPLYISELGCAKRIIEISSEKVPYRKEDFEGDIKKYEDENNITFAEEQKEAIVEGVKNNMCIITGGPGTGKTTIIKCIIKIFERMGLTVVLAAPTGRAAKRITETTGYEAKTIHRLLEMEFIDSEDTPSFEKNEDDPLEADAIIIDEASMIDISLMYSFLRAVPQSTRLIMVGDIDQLPSVGPGNVLRDIINSKAVSVVRLKHIYRQADESLITYNAHKINDGEMPVLNERDKDFFFIQKGTPLDIVNEIVELAGKRLPSYKKDIDPKADIQVLSPSRKGETGVTNLNLRLQEAINPPSKDKKERKFRDYSMREGDKVMQIKNNYNLEWKRDSKGESETGKGVFNGDIGFIEYIDNASQKVCIKFDDDRVVNYDFSNLDELELAYAVTVHKSQGSEFKIVIIPINYGAPMLMTRNLIYTAVTRAKNLLVMVGIKQALYVMINNNTIARRYSSLENRIINMYNAFK